MTDRDLMIEARGVEKWYPNGYHALRGVDLNVYRGEVVVIMGPSGSGKSTFIRTFNALEDFQGGGRSSSMGWRSPMTCATSMPSAGRWGWSFNSSTCSRT